MRLRRHKLILLCCAAGVFCSNAAGETDRSWRADDAGPTANNFNPPDSLCLELRSVEVIGSTVGCTSEDSECPGGTEGASRCIDDDLDPLNGSVCVDPVCFAQGGEFIVDVELGETTAPACGAQIFLEWDVAALDFVSIETDPESEFGASPPIISLIDPVFGTIDVTIGLAPALPCNALNGAVHGGTIMRLVFTPIADCLVTDAVRFRKHDPPTSIGGAFGPIPLTGCDGDVEPSAIGDIVVYGEPPIWECPHSSSGGARCGSVLREVLFPPIIVTDPCDTVSQGATDFCTVEYFPACLGDLDCGRGNLCSGSADCGGDVCVEHADAVGFPCPGNTVCIGFCREDVCEGTTCAVPVIPFGIDLDDYLDGGGEFLPGRTEIRCSYTAACGVTSDCAADIENNGLNTLVVDVDLSPTMAHVFPDAPVQRCLDFAVSECGSAGDPVVVSHEVAFGLLGDAREHGSAVVEVPAALWTCLAVRDPRHTLASSCSIACDPQSGEFHATLGGSPASNPTCHWLIQGDVDGSGTIDIVDQAILVGQYMAQVGMNSPCDHDAFHPDLNGDGFVTLADYTFIVLNMFEHAVSPCAVVCNPGAASAQRPRRSEITVAELQQAGLTAAAAAHADLNHDGKVDLSDVAMFLETNGDDDPGLARQLESALRRKASSVGLR